MESKKYLIHSIKLIKKFDKIFLNNEKPLIICDIDNTILYRNKENDNIEDDINNCFFYKPFVDCFSKKKKREILPTDIDGFRRLEEKVRNLNGKIIFLSGRGIKRKKIIEKDFIQIGLDSKKYDIHYTTKKYSKGRYVYENIKLDHYKDVFFIDDLYENHESMFSFFPKFKYYLFCDDTLI
jgi:hydroxymethylpyrimidine pyrophosphatase-like HAD family hydrolase